MSCLKVSFSKINPTFKIPLLYVFVNIQIWIIFFTWWKKRKYFWKRHFFSQKVTCLNKIKVVFISVEIKLDYLLAKDRIKRSLNLEVMCEWASVLYLAWTSILIVNNCFREVTDFNRRTTKPPPSTVSIVLANKFGVNASKSWSTTIPNVFPRILCVSL